MLQSIAKEYKVDNVQSIKSQAIVDMVGFLTVVKTDQRSSRYQQTLAYNRLQKRTEPH